MWSGIDESKQEKHIKTHTFYRYFCFSHRSFYILHLSINTTFLIERQMKKMTCSLHYKGTGTDVIDLGSRWERFKGSASDCVPEIFPTKRKSYQTDRIPREYEGGTYGVY